jgi:hypothetical protein
MQFCAVNVNSGSLVSVARLLVLIISNILPSSDIDFVILSKMTTKLIIAAPGVCRK